MKWWAGVEPWRRNQLVVVIVVAACFFGLDVAAPFFPLFFRELGVSSVEDLALWSGFSYAMAPLFAALTTPFWAAVAERIGAKLMVARSMVVFTMCMALMPFVQEPWQLLGLRILAGTFGGFGVLTIALITAGSPRERVGQAVGLAQSAQFMPLAIGPSIGGLLAEHFGLRANFWFAAAFMAFAVVVLVFGYKPIGPATRSTGSGQAGRSGRKAPVRGPAIVAAAAAMFMAQYVDKSFNPVLPLLLEARGAGEGNLAIATGLVVSVAAIGSACAGWLFGRLAVRYPSHLLLAGAFGLGVAAGIPLALAGSVELFALLRVLTSLAAGGAVAMAFTTGIRNVPPERSTSATAFVGTGGMYAMALSPLATGLLARQDLQAMLWLNAALFAAGAAMILIAFARRPVRRTAGGVVPPAPEAGLGRSRH